MFKDLTISSPDFPNLGAIPERFTLDAENLVPRINIKGVPADAVELAIVCHDPDAPLANGFTHWVLYGLPAETLELGRDADAQYRPGPNGAGLHHWAGPQPPVGHGRHHYYFWVYALSKSIDGTPTREEFLSTYADSIVEQARFVGTFEN